MASGANLGRLTYLATTTPPTGSQPSLKSPSVGSSALLGRVSPTPVDSSSSKIKKVFYCIGFVFASILAAVPAFFTFPRRIYTWLQTKSLKQETKENQIDKIVSVLDMDVNGKVDEGSSTSFRNCTFSSENSKHRAYYKKATKIRDKLLKFEDKKEKVSSDSAFKIYRDVQKLLGQNPGSKWDKIFSELNGKNDPAVKFLQYVAFKYRVAKGPSLANHAQDIYGKDLPQPATDGTYTVQQTAELTDKAIDRPSLYKRTGRAKVAWMISHLGGLFHSGEAEFFPQDYNPHENNPTYVAKEAQYKDKQGNLIDYSFIAGPTPINDRAYERGFLRVKDEIRFNNIDAHLKNEQYFVKNVDEAMRGSPDSTHVILGFDAKFKTPEMKAAFKMAKNPAELIDRYKELLIAKGRELGEHGIQISKEQLSDAEIIKACECSKEYANGVFTSPATEEQMKSIIAIVDTMMSLGILVKKLEQPRTAGQGLDPDLKRAYISVACKQCFDRGPVYLAMLMLFMRSLDNSKNLSEDEYYSICALFTRSLSGEDRNTMGNRFALYREFAKSCDMRRLAISTGKYQEFLRKPSNL